MLSGGADFSLLQLSSEFRVPGSCCMFRVSCFVVYGLWIQIEGSGLGFKVKGSGFRVQGKWFRVEGKGGDPS